MVLSTCWEVDLELKVNSLASRLASVSLVMHKGQSNRSGRQAVTSQDARVPYQERSRNATLSYVYCYRAGNIQNNCWKKQRAAFICIYCSRRGHDDTDCWAEKREKREQDVTKDQQFNMMCEIKDDDRLVPEIIAAVCRKRDGKHGKSKQAFLTMVTIARQCALKTKSPQRLNFR